MDRTVYVIINYCIVLKYCDCYHNSLLQVQTSSYNWITGACSFPVQRWNGESDAHQREKFGWLGGKLVNDDWTELSAETCRIMPDGGGLPNQRTMRCLLWRHQQGRQPASVKFTWRRFSFQNAADGAVGRTHYWRYEKCRSVRSRR